HPRSASPKLLHLNRSIRVMARPCTPSLAAALLCLVIISGERFLPQCAGCPRDDRRALLDIQSFLSEHLPLNYWDSSIRDCCQWRDVTCDSRTGRVTGLDLDAFPYPPASPLNTSLFLPLEELQSLSLKNVGINGCMPGAGMRSLSVCNALTSFQ
uniref:Leucine-rich repeat-containing N-terminal plant-type domain-containing protein n=1 Tax=Aegilops tauschii subsp. strangulata TaxID=200361 RepID=A0A453QXE6_AEGTS